MRDAQDCSRFHVNCSTQAITLTIRQNRTSTLPFCLASRKIVSYSSPQNPNRTHSSLFRYCSGTLLRSRLLLRNRSNVPSLVRTSSRIVFRVWLESFRVRLTQELCARRSTVVNKALSSTTTGLGADRGQRVIRRCYANHRRQEVASLTSPKL